MPQAAGCYLGSQVACDLSRPRFSGPWVLGCHCVSNLLAGRAYQLITRSFVCPGHSVGTERELSVDRLTIQLIGSPHQCR